MIFDTFFLTFKKFNPPYMNNCPPFFVFCLFLSFVFFPPKSLTVSFNQSLIHSLLNLIFPIAALRFIAFLTLVDAKLETIWKKKVISQLINYELWLIILKVTFKSIPAYFNAFCSSFDYTKKFVRSLGLRPFFWFFFFFFLWKFDQTLSSVMKSIYPLTGGADFKESPLL